MPTTTNTLPWKIETQNKKKPFISDLILKNVLSSITSSVSRLLRRKILREPLLLIDFVTRSVGSIHF
jgi:hypothetical protein